MTRKDYEAIAKVIAQANMALESRVTADSDRYNEGGEDMLHFVANNLCVTLKADNPNFDRSRFLRACGF